MTRIRLFPAAVAAAPTSAGAYNKVGLDETTSRELTLSTAGSASGILTLTYFTATASETVTNVITRVGGAYTGTVTIARIGLYSIAGNGDGTLVASTTNDITLFATLNTNVTKAFTATYAKVAGQRYALGYLVVGTGLSVGQFASKSLQSQGINDIPPRLCAVLNAQTDLPSSFTAGSLSSHGKVDFYALT